MSRIAEGHGQQPPASDPVRTDNGERSVSALEAVVPLSQSALSQHLAKLREYGVVTTRREAQSIYYSLADPRVASLIGTLYELFCAPTKSGSKRRKK